MAGKNKIITVLVVFLMLILTAGLGAFKPKETQGSAGITKGITEKKLKKLGGLKTRMPENSALVFFKSTLGADITSYKASKNMDEALFDLKAGKTDVVWACDVTADFLLKTDDSLKKVDTENMADIQKTEAPRFSFGMALKKNKGEALRDEINGALSEIKMDGTLDRLVEAYVTKAADYESESGRKLRFYSEKMKAAKGNDKIKVGITGAVLPLELLDEEGKPYGFCVALMDEIGSRTGKKIQFVLLDNETAFTSLMSERVDVIFAYGTGKVTTEYKQKFITTDGYLDMQRYEFLTLE